MPKRRCLGQFDLQICFSLQRRANFRHCNFKLIGTPQFFDILTWNVLLAAAGAIFHIRTSKSGPRMVCFAHFNLQMCFSLQRANFAHPDFKKWSEHAVFCTFWLTNVRLATAACNFSTSGLQKVVREWFVLYSLT